MKWIGQHIWDFISRFRSDVYMEAIESGTIASGGNLGLDSNNKVVKEADTGITDLHGAGVDGAANQMLTDDGDGTVTSEANLTYNGVTLDVNGSSTIGNTVANPLLTLDTSTTTTAGMSGVLIDVDGSSTGANDTRGITVDLDNSGVAGSGITHVTRGVVVDINNAATNDSNSTVTHWGVTNTGTFANATGTTTQYGFHNVLSGGDTQYGLYQDLSGATAGTTYGIWQDVVDGGTDLMFVSSADNGDYFSIATTTNGATNITTVDDDAYAAHLSLNIDGNIRLDALSKQTYIAWNGTNIWNFDANAGAFKQAHLTNSGDYYSITLGTNGATTFSTVDADTTVAHLTFDADGDIESKSATNKINKIYDFHGTTFENTYSDDQGAGTILKYSPGADESPAGSELLYLHTDGTWDAARATAVATGASQLLGVGLGASARTTGVLIKGFIRIASTEILNVPGSGAVDGLPVYVSTTSAHFDFTAPSGSSQYVRIIGYAIDDDSSDVLIYFDPDKTWVEIA